MAFRLSKSETIPLTRELAERILHMTPSVTERELDDDRVKYLQQQAGAGRLVNFNWTIALLNGKEYRMNGLHSSTMLCGLDGMFPDNLNVHLDTFDVDDERDLPVLFRQFDNRRSARTQADVSGAYQMLHPSLRDIPKGVAKLGAEGINTWLKIMDRPHFKGDDAYEIFDHANYHDFLRWFATVVGKKTPELRKKEVVAAMYATFLANETEARRFWAEVSRGNGDDSATSVLGHWLLKMVTDSDLPRDQRASGMELYQGSIYAWNAEREGRTLSTMRYPDVKRRLLTAKS